MNRRSHAPSRRNAGFTILEIVIVFILLAGIMAFVGPKIYDMMFKAEAQQARIQLLDLAGKIEMGWQCNPAAQSHFSFRLHSQCLIQAQPLLLEILFKR